MESSLVAALLVETPVITAAEIVASSGSHPALVAFLVIIFLVGFTFGALICYRPRLPPNVRRYVPEVEFDSFNSFIESHVTYRIPSWLFGRGGDAGDRASLSRDTASVSWARLRERIGAGLDEDVTGFAARAHQDEEEVKEKPPAATPSPIYLVNPIFENLPQVGGGAGSSTAREEAAPAKPARLEAGRDSSSTGQTSDPKEAGPSVLAFDLLQP
jgi:hypothetical protein